MKRPNFFIIGAPKCGTTALASYLSAHPEVFMTVPKEPHHYNTDLEHGSYKEKERYFCLFSDASEKYKAVGEASVWYMYSKAAIRNILIDAPEAKFVVMLRNPVEMAPSLHEQMLFSGYENVQSFAEAWNLQKRRLAGEKIPRWCCEPLFLQYRDVCSLGLQYERLRKQVDETKLFTIIFDDFKSNPRRVWADLLDFLEVSDDGRREFPVVNSAKKRKSMLLKRVNDVYARARRSLGIPGLGTGIFTALDRRNYKAVSRDPLPEYLIEAMKLEFEQDVARLSFLLDRDLTHWVK